MNIHQTPYLMFLLMQIAYAANAVAQESADGELLYSAIDVFYYDAQEQELAVVTHDEEVVIYDEEFEKTDEVIIDCLPDPKSVKRTLSAALTRNHFIVTDEGVSRTFPYDGLGFRPYFEANFKAYHTSLGCIVDYYFAYSRPIVANVPYTTDEHAVIIHKVLWIDRGSWIGTASSVQKRIQDESANAADKFLSRITSAKRRMEKDYPNILRKINENKKSIGKE